MNKRKIEPLGVLLVLACMALLIGIKTFLKPCEGEGEEIMSCHYIEQAVFGVAVVLAIQGFCAVIMGLEAPNLRKGISIAMIPTAALAAVIPGYLIDLCEDSTMACNTTMRPGVMVLGLGIAVLASLYATPGTFIGGPGASSKTTSKKGKKK